MNRKMILVFLPIVLACASARADKLEFAIIGDGGRWNQNSTKVRDSIVRLKVRDLILPGDNLYGWFNSYQKSWNPWKEKQLNFSVVAIGNYNGGYKQEIKYFAMPEEYFAKK